MSLLVQILYVITCTDASSSSSSDSDSEDDSEEEDKTPLVKKSKKGMHA